MFDNLNWWEIGALLLVALLIFGDRLPTVISDGLRMVRNLRNMARNATGDLSRELGTDIQLEDLHPKAFIRKHLLSEEDEEALRKPLQGMLNDVRADLNGVHNDLKDVASAVDLKSGSAPATSSSGAAGQVSANGSAAASDTAISSRPNSFDLDAT